MGIEEIEQKDYFSIGDVKRITGVPEYSVRYWEAEFGLIRPIRLESGHRRYTKKDVYTILKIKDLIYKHKLHRKARHFISNIKGKNQNNEHEKDYRERAFKISEKIIIGKILKSGLPERKIPSRQIKRVSYGKSG